MALGEQVQASGYAPAFPTELIVGVERGWTRHDRGSLENWASDLRGRFRARRGRKRKARVEEPMGP